MPDLNFQSDKSTGYVTNQMGRLFGQLLAAQVETFGVMPAQFMVLTHLWTKDGITQKRLLSQVDVEQATLANTLNRMERDGLIRRERDKKDGRAAFIFLTKRAKELERPLIGIANEINAQALSGLTVDEANQFLALSHRIIGRLQTMREDIKPATC